MTDPIESGFGSVSRAPRDPRWGWLVSWRGVALLAILLYLPWGGQRSLWFPDEPDVAEPVMTMYESGDWLVPRRNEEAWLDYPPLTYWLSLASSHLFGGPSPFALRLPVGILAVLVVALTGFVGERLAGREVALWTSACLATAPHFAYQAVNLHPDMAFALLIAAGLALYAWGVERHTGWRSGGLRAAGFSCFGAAILSKGILGLLLPGLILVVWHLSLRRWAAILWMAPLSLVALAVAAPWYLLLAAELSGEHVWREIYLQNFARFGAANRGHEEAWHYYLVRLWTDWMPWCLLLPGALITAFRRDWGLPLRRLLLLCFVVSFVFFSLAATKREVYLLPIYPAIAFLIGREAALRFELPYPAWSRWLIGALGAVTLLAGAALLAGVASGVERPLGRAALALSNDDDGLRLSLILLSAVLAIGGFLVLRLAARGVSPSLLATLGVLLFFVYSISLAGLAPRLDGAKSYRSAALWLRQESGSRPIGYYLPGAETKFAGIRVNDPSRLPLELLETPAEAARYLEDPGNLVLLRVEHAEAVAPLVPDWEHLPKRPLSLSGMPFLTLGPLAGATTR